MLYKLKFINLCNHLIVYKAYICWYSDKTINYSLIPYKSTMN